MDSAFCFSQSTRHSFSSSWGPGLLPIGPFTQIQAFLFFACDLLSLTRTSCEAECETIQGSLVGSLFHTQSKAMTVLPPESIRIDRRCPFWPFRMS